MQAEIRTLFQSPFVRILDFRCQEPPHQTSVIEHTTRNEIAFIRTGSFVCHQQRRDFEVDSRHVIFVNAGTEQAVSHHEIVQDTCTIFQFSELLLDEARSCYWNKKVQQFSSGAVQFPFFAVRTNPRVDLLHSKIMQAARQNGAERLYSDSLCIDLLHSIFEVIYDRHPLQLEHPSTLRFRDHHLEIVERAKHFILENSNQDLSLSDIAQHAYASEFHFSRLFKDLMCESPYQYLLQVRLNQAALLLRNTKLPVTEICFRSGFQSIAHFTASFTRNFGLSPSRFRKSGTHHKDTKNTKSSDF